MKAPMTTVLAFALGFGAVAAYNTHAEAAPLPVCNTGARILCLPKAKAKPLPVPHRPAAKPYKAKLDVCRTGARIECNAKAIRRG